MTVAYDPVQAGEDVLDVNVQQIIDGITGATMNAHTMVNDSATVAPLTLKSTHATGPALLIKDYVNADSIKVSRLASSNDAAQLFETVEFKGGAKISMRSDGTAPRSPMFFDMYRSDADTGTVFYQNIYDNNWVGTPASADVATAAFIGRQNTGDSYFRTVEIDHHNMSGAVGSQPHLGIELSVQTSVVGNGSDRVVGIAVHNYGSLWGIPTPQRADTGILIGRDDFGFEFGVLYLDKTSAGSGILFSADKNGLVACRGMSPAAGGSILGATGNLWASTYSSLFFAGLGSVTAPGYAINGDANTGLYSTGADALNVTTGGVQRQTWDANGNIIFGAGAVATNATNGFMHIITCAGAPTGAPGTVTGRLPMVYDATNNKLYLYNGTWKGVTLA